MRTEESTKTVSEKSMEREDRFGAHNYKPIPVVIDRGEGVFVWDAEGKRYYDFLASYSALNQGHCHPRLVNLVKEQVEKLTLTTRTFYNTSIGMAAEFLSST